MKIKSRVAVVGGGHAGVEAALACARLGIDTTLFSLSLDQLGNMPCNPSIGGTAKGHLVYEIDALGGEMGRAADKVTLQSRTLNLGKGAAETYLSNYQHLPSPQSFLRPSQNMHHFPPLKSNSLFVVVQS